MYVFGATSEAAGELTGPSADGAVRVATDKLKRFLGLAWGPNIAWLTGVAAVRMPNGQRVIEVGLHPGLGRQTLPEIPSQVDGFPVILTRNVISLADPRRMAVAGGWPLTRYGRPV